MNQLSSGKGKTGLVLSGGLFRNAFQVGVIEGLMERGFDPQVVVGVSSGAWNGACLVAGQLEKMRDFWIRVGEMPKLSLRNLFFNKTLFNLRYIVHQIPKKSLNFSRICASSVEFHVGTTRLWDFKPRFFCNHQVRSEDFFSILMASNLIPGLYAWPVKIGNAHYIDGGFLDNVPYEVAFEAGCDRVYIVVPNYGGTVLKKLWQSKSHPIPLPYRPGVTIISPPRPLHRLCTKKHQIEEAMELGYEAGWKVVI